MDVGFRRGFYGQASPIPLARRDAHAYGQTRQRIGAGIHIATFRVPMSDPVNASFIAELDRVNALAECAPGFVWRLVGEGNNAMDIRAFGEFDLRRQEPALDATGFGEFQVKCGERQLQRFRKRHIPSVVARNGVAQLPDAISERIESEGLKAEFH